MRWTHATIAAALLGGSGAGSLAAVGCSEQVILGGTEPAPVVCQDAACGAACDPCPAGDTSCAAHEGYGCDPKGACVMAPSCLPPYDPCSGKTCRAPCSLCAPEDPTCTPPMKPTACDAMGACVDAMGIMCPKMPWMPCAQKGCGDPCTQCDPADPKCHFQPGQACDPLGQCRLFDFMCPPPPPPPDAGDGG